MALPGDHKDVRWRGSAPLAEEAETATETRYDDGEARIRAKIVQKLTFLYIEMIKPKFHIVFSCYKQRRL